MLLSVNSKDSIVYFMLWLPCSTVYLYSTCVRKTYVKFEVYLGLTLPTVSWSDLPAYTAAKKLQANAEESSDDLANPPKVEEKLGAVPHGLSTDAEVAQRCEQPSDQC